MSGPPRRRRLFQDPAKLAANAVPDPAGMAAGETAPWDVPGTRLRASSSKGARGWYAPSAKGAPSTTRQAEILNTALIGPPTGTDGIVNGRDMLSRTTISHDAFTAYNAEPRRITSPNCVVSGSVGKGKSSLTKTLFVLRPLVLERRRAVIFDKKKKGEEGSNGDEGEYADVVRRFGAEPIRFSPDAATTRLNLFDPMMVRGGGVAGQVRLLRTVAALANGGAELTKWENEAVRSAFRRMHETGTARGRRAAARSTERAFVLTDLLPHLGLIADDPEYRDLSGAVKEELHRAGVSVRLIFNGLVEEYGGMFDGETSADVDLQGKVTSFDISQLPDEGPAVPIVMALGNEWLMGRLQDERGWGTNVIWEEGWHFIGGPSASLIRSSAKLSRSLGLCNVFVMHKVSDIPEGSPGMSIIQEAQTIYTFGHDRAEDAAVTGRTFGYAPETVDLLLTLKPGHFVFKYGSQPETHVRHVRSGWETAVTNTDQAIAAMQHVRAS
ncbi:hypothetical protein ASF48_17700 [Rathayibacter sp. Leaf299]|nr:hypothetical protein ASF48_17700 [Rathayibacter sp. Leaf299]